MRTWCLDWGRAEAVAFLDQDDLHLAGATKTQTVRMIGFALILIGGALFVTARRRQRRERRALAEARQLRELQRRRQYQARGVWRPEHPPGPPAGDPYRPPRRYHWPDLQDWPRGYELPELIHRPEKPDFRNRIRGP